MLTHQQEPSKAYILAGIFTLSLTTDRRLDLFLSFLAQTRS